MARSETPVATSTQDECALADIASAVAREFIHHLAPSFRPPARLITPSDKAEQSVVEAVTQAAAERGIPTEVIDLRPAPTERLDAVTARLGGFGASDDEPATTPTLLILRGFDVFGDDAHDAPTYPFRSEFQFDQSFLWLFIGRDRDRMRWLFGSYNRPLYHAAGDITPEAWRPTPSSSPRARRKGRMTGHHLDPKKRD